MASVACEVDARPLERGERERGLAEIDRLVAGAREGAEELLRLGAPAAAHDNGRDSMTALPAGGATCVGAPVAGTDWTVEGCTVEG